MSKYLPKVSITIRRCEDCPHVSHSGRLAATVYHTCEKADGRNICLDTDNEVRIPNWCPLHKEQEIERT